MTFADIPWSHGSTDEGFGTKVWVARIENLRIHFAIIRDFLPEEADWLRNDVAFEASRMILASGLPGGTKHARTKTRAFAEGCMHATSSIIAAIERGDHLAQRGKDAL